MVALLTWWETINKDKHGKHCHNQCKHFSLFIVSVNGILGRKALAVLTQLSKTMAEKMEKRIPHIWVWINGQITIAVAVYYSQKIYEA